MQKHILIMGLVFLDLGNIEEAKKIYKKSLSLDSNNKVTEARK